MKLSSLVSGKLSKKVETADSGKLKLFGDDALSEILTFAMPCTKNQE